ncbi:hypothetical protein HMPREF0545_1433 [Ligilactobacillus salivarius DSM 20555 = ATCC 11741]|uniref:Uncharacterized protein n=1 Tax=Ligilactobacillus salivarius DSM 20555 = ATCC 11741 TaxID=1423799 RepID=C2EIG1_9LACO|nr:hypothetical protein HMPREF0545_1433 [Ligilactobacillus salivarius DSM 20555 = ATCC 11741]
MRMETKFFLIDTKMDNIWTNIIIAANSLEEAEAKVKEMQSKKNS